MGGGGDGQRWGASWSRNIGFPNKQHRKGGGWRGRRRQLLKAPKEDASSAFRSNSPSVFSAG